VCTTTSAPQHNYNDDDADEAARTALVPRWLGVYSEWRLAESLQSCNDDRGDTATQLHNDDDVDGDKGE